MRTLRESEYFVEGMTLELDKIRESSGAATVLYEPVVESTNDWAIESARIGDVMLPALFLANEQTRGRGRGDKQWSSSKGALTFSLLVERPVPLESAQGGLIALVVADAICQTVNETCGLSPEIKWPNDVFLNDRKVAGILIESARAKLLVIGCGVNVSNSTAHIDGATNIAFEVEAAPSNESILLGIVRRTICGLSGLGTFSGQKSQGVIPESTNNGFIVELLARCRARDWLLGRKVENTAPGSTLKGTASGFSDDGGLIVEIEGGEKRIVRSGSIRAL